MIKFNPKNCINCLSCMTIDECRDYIDAKRYGRPYFKEKPECQKCTKCIDICGKKALTKRSR